MNKKFIKVISLFLTLCIMLMPLSQIQAETFSTSASASSSISEGEEFVVTFSFSSSINIYAIEGTLSYDSSKLSLTSYSGAGAFNATVGGRISAYTTSDTTGGSFASVTFKALSGFKEGDSATISLTNVSGSDGDNDVSASGCSVSVSIPKSPSSDPGKTNEPTNNNPGSSNNSSSTKNDPTLSSDSSLKGLSIEGYTLSPSFSSSRYTYSVTVSASEEKLNITALPNDSKASVRYEGNELKEGTTSQVFVIVTAQNGSTSTYTIEATRGSDPNKKASDNAFLSQLIPSSGKLSPVFDKNTFNYVVEAESSVKEMTFSITPEDPNAVCNVIGEAQLIAGRENMYHIICTAADGVSSKIYTVTVISAQNYETYISKSFINSVIKRIKNAEPNIFLDMSFCSVQLLSADIFKALSEQEGVVLSVKTKNGIISFDSSETNYEITQDIYDLTMIRSSTYSSDFLSSMGSYENYVFSTHYKDELPGFATFSVYTNFKKNQIVNVYAYDSSEDKMIIAAKNISVEDGGVVSFEIDKGGDFVITTMDVEGAEEYHSLNRVNNTPSADKILQFGAIALLSLLLGFVFGNLANTKHKPKKRALKPSSVKKTDKNEKLNEAAKTDDKNNETKAEAAQTEVEEDSSSENKEVEYDQNEENAEETGDDISDFEAMLDKRLKK